MDETKIKEAFQKVKEDIVFLKDQLVLITQQIEEIKRIIRPTDTQTDKPTDSYFIQTHVPALPTQDSAIQTIDKKPKNKTPSERPKPQNFDISTGNRGVPADRPTDTQTDRQTDKYDYKLGSNHLPTEPIQKFVLNTNSEDPVTKIGKVAELINSLDALKKDLRKQFKRLTPQEMLVFSTIYQLTDQAIEVDYSILAKKTSLTESSIRDYIQKLLRKGIPLEKIRENNKRILLTIPPEFKRMASLDTLISLRNL